MVVIVSPALVGSHHYLPCIVFFLFFDSLGVSCPDDHLIYFRFLGRVIGRALFDRQLIKGHMVQSIYKHLLGWPITFEDIKAQDEEYYQLLKKLSKMEDVSLMCLDFTVTEEEMGVRREVELMEGGSLSEVTNENMVAPASVRNMLRKESTWSSVDRQSE